MARKSRRIGHHLLRPRIDEYLEELFTSLRVVRQRSVGEAKPGVIIRAADTVENTATVQRPEPEMADQNRHNVPTATGRVPWKRFDPADVGVLVRRSICLAAPIATVASSRSRRTLTSLTIPIGLYRQRQVSRFTKEPVDAFRRRTSSQKHGSLRRTRDCRIELHGRARRRRSRTGEPEEPAASAPQRAAVAG